MRFAEVNLFGVYVAPISLLMVLALVLLVVMRRIASYFGLLRFVWYMPLFEFAAYVILLSSIVISVG